MVVKLNVGGCILFALAITGCVEFFEFNTENELPAVVIEGYVSDVSSNDYYQQYDEPRYFELKLKWASRVKNLRDETISGAEVELFSKTRNEYWDYTEFENGQYQLLHGDFEAEPNHEYQIQVTLPNGNIILSDFEVMPEQAVTGNISFVETSSPKYVYEREELVIKEVDGVDVNMSLPETPGIDQHYYRWNYLTTWVLRAIRIPESSPVGLCWVTEQYFLDEYQLAEYYGDPIERKLFFLKTSGNLPIRHGFSVRVNQTAMNKDYFNFWNDLENQKKQADLFAPPPYNLGSNLSSETANLEVYGYFGVVREENYTWYFDPDDLSYLPTFTEPCHLPFANDRPFYCEDCLDYEALRYRDKITNIEPIWWDM